MTGVAKGSLLVVGAGPGIGLATARRFGREGHRVGLVGRTADRLTPLREALDADGVTTSIAAADITDPAALTGAVESVRDQLGPIEVMLFSPRPDIAWIKPVLDTTASQLSAALDLSVVAAATAVNLVVADMRGRGRGTLLFTTGGAAVEPHSDRAVSGIAYAAESVYVRMLHDALAPQDIHVAQVTIVGAVGADGRHHPNAVADELWRRHSLRDQPLIVLR